MDQIHNDKGDNVAGNKYVYFTRNNGEKIAYDREKVIREFFLRLDRDLQEDEFEEKFLIKKENRPFFFFVHGSCSDMHQYLIYRIELFIQKQSDENKDGSENKDDILKTELIDAHFFHYVKTMSNVHHSLNKTISEYFNNKGRNIKIKYQEYKNADEMLKQLCLNNTLVLLNHDIHLSSWNSKMQELLVKYIEFWNCCQDIKVVIFINIINDIPESKEQSVDKDSEKLIENFIGEIQDEFKSYCYSLTKLLPLTHKDINAFVKSVNSCYNTKSFHIHANPGALISMEQAVSDYSVHVAQYLYERDLYCLDNY